ncbi:superoxide dismutase family protein [Planomonospora venezuelensis]|uniref:Superoxide dismutase [Cu-Zn] n=1 Tax=Planomonospora venezuelensis TaxID=1999 RepID=A0A841CYQ7_PLAVE|nr:superoxide dismutase family protein [Planomonospora venezuelensis]MBB5963121.1 Cu-Zn family superoxide dismutase [Planomonospora venezuelensis]GIM99995.1 superoxide dismutase [Cu-Zn] [Planomonospora venezuelensis]
MLRRTQLALAATLGAGVIAAGAGMSAGATPQPPDAPTEGTSDPLGPIQETPPGPDDIMPAPGPVPPTPADRSPAGSGPARAEIRDVNGKAVGTLDLVEDQDGKPQLKVTVSGLPAGYHGFHIHSKGVCDPASTDPATGSPFFSAGEHFNLGPESHPGHSGDLPDLLVGKNGTGSATVVTDRFQIKQLLDADGSAVIVHAAADNKANIPGRYSRPSDTTDPDAPTTMTTGPDEQTLKTGDSGGRIACGVIAAS